MLINNSNPVKYRVVVQGVTVSEHTNRILAEAHLTNLSEDVKGRAQIVPVMEDGRQFLLG